MSSEVSAFPMRVNSSEDLHTTAAGAPAPAPAPAPEAVSSGRRFSNVTKFFGALAVVAALVAVAATVVLYAPFAAPALAFCGAFAVKTTAITAGSVSGASVLVLAAKCLADRVQAYRDSKLERL